MNIMHARSYEKINEHLNKSQMLYIVLHNRKGDPSLSQYEIFLSKIDNEPILLYSSGKSSQIFGPRWETVLVPYLQNLIFSRVLLPRCYAGCMKLKMFIIMFVTCEMICRLNETENVYHNVCYFRDDMQVEWNWKCLS